VQGSQIGHDTAIHQGLEIGHQSLIYQRVNDLPISGIPTHQQQFSFGHTDFQIS
jgi:UDP-3-O-[3-hydroxymyristoyl] glucosamine N-acyltransferase